MSGPVLVVVGVGGMGLAIARRLGAGSTVVLADADEATLAAVAGSLEADGHRVVAHPVDVAAADQVAGLAQVAGDLGAPLRLAHTAGLSPAQASAEAILRVDLLGVALVTEAFGRVVGPGGAGVVIASMAGHLAAGALGPEAEAALCTTAAEDLLQLPAVRAAAGDPGAAYAVAKRATQLWVQAASVAWGERGARLNSISPGIISTPMGRQELASEQSTVMRALLDAAAAGRVGTPDDIAAAAAFLLGPDATYVTGVDLLVDGGVVAAVRAGRLSLG